MLKPEEISTLYQSMAHTVGTPAMAELDREMIPILTEVATLECRNKDHPKIKQLYKWLLVPQRTAQEFCYVIGPLIQHVVKSQRNAFYYYVSSVAAEAIAMRCPVLEGPWEEAAWILAIYGRLNSVYERFNDISSHVGTWLTSVIGDPDLCPNPYLRIELISLLQDISSKFSIQNRTDALESVLSAYSYLNNLDNFNQHRNIHYLNYNLDYFVKDTNVKAFDKKLAQSLLAVKASSCSAALHFVPYISTVNPRKYTEPKALNGIIALLKTISGCARKSLQTFKQAEFDWWDLMENIKDITCILYILLSNFKESCQTPQLVSLTASSIVDVLELAISVSRGQPDEDEYDIGVMYRCEYTLGCILNLVPTLLGEKTVHSISGSPLCREINYGFQKRLKRLYEVLHHMEVHEDLSTLKYALDLIVTSLVIQK